MNAPLVPFLKLIMLSCKRRIPESKVLALFKPLPNTVFTNIQTHLTIQSSKYRQGWTLAFCPPFWFIGHSAIPKRMSCIRALRIKTKIKRTEPKPQLNKKKERSRILNPVRVKNPIRLDFTPLHPPPPDWIGMQYILEYSYTVRVTWNK